MTTPTDAAGGLYRLLAWLSPNFPTGAFSYSHGIEAAVAADAVRDRDTLQTWVAAVIAHGSGRMDADVLHDAYHAAREGDARAVAAAHQRGAAYRPTAELALESGQQGAAFIATHEAAWVPGHPHPDPPPLAGEGADRAAAIINLSDLAKSSSPAGGGQSGATAAAGALCHAAAFGAAAARARIALDAALLGYLQAFAANLIAAGLRLGVIGQTDGQRILTTLEPVVGAAAAEAIMRDPADFGSASFAADLMSIAHETQYSRLFRS